VHTDLSDGALREAGLARVIARMEQIDGDSIGRDPARKR
jgi:hypothetical protein